MNKFSVAEHKLLKETLEEKLQLLEAQQVVTEKEIRQAKAMLKKISGMSAGGQRAISASTVTLETIMRIISESPDNAMSAGQIRTRYKEKYGSELAYSSMRAKLNDGKANGYIDKKGEHRGTRWKLTGKVLVPGSTVSFINTTIESEGEIKDVVAD